MYKSVVPFTIFFVVSQEAQGRAGGPVGNVAPLDNPVGFVIAMLALFLVGVAVFVWIWRTTPKG